MQKYVHLLLLLLSLALLGCEVNEAKSAEKRILSDINRMTEESRMRMHTPEIRSSLKRMGDLRPQFPNNRDEIEKEAKAIRTLYSNLITDNEETDRKWDELLALPLSPSYRRCVELQIRSSHSSTAGLKLAVEEMDLLLDRAIVDNESLQVALNPLRAKQEAVDAQNKEIEAEVATNCRRGSF